MICATNGDITDIDIFTEVCAIRFGFARQFSNMAYFASTENPLRANISCILLTYKETRVNVLYLVELVDRAICAVYPINNFHLQLSDGK